MGTEFTNGNPPQLVSPRFMDSGQYRLIATQGAAYNHNLTQLRSLTEGPFASIFNQTYDTVREELKDTMRRNGGLIVAYRQTDQGTFSEYAGFCAHRVVQIPTDDGIVRARYFVRGILPGHTGQQLGGKFLQFANSINPTDLLAWKTQVEPSIVSVEDSGLAGVITPIHQTYGELPQRRELAEKLALKIPPYRPLDNPDTGLIKAAYPEGKIGSYPDVSKDPRLQELRRKLLALGLVPQRGDALLCITDIRGSELFVPELQSQDVPEFADPGRFDPLSIIRHILRI